MKREEIEIKLNQKYFIGTSETSRSETDKKNLQKFSRIKLLFSRILSFFKIVSNVYREW